MRVAVLGMGAMGSRMAAALLRAGHSVTVWNRTEARAQPLLAQGAKMGRSPRTAAAESEFVVSMVRDDEASRHVWLSPEVGALAAMSRDAIGIESSTLSTAWVQELSAAFAAGGVPLLDAPVVGSRAQADAGSLIYLVGGDAEVMTRAKPILTAIGSTVHYTGPSGSGAALKLIVNALLGIQVAALAELLAAVERIGLDPHRAGEVLMQMPSCSASAKGITQAMLARNFAPAFPVELIAKDFGYMLRNTADMTPISAAAQSVFERAIAAGFATDNMTGVAKLYEER
jgi:3-hydroxyisobutyrate dehydrogenase-like beta-hydroxyacid dehydrogenase